MSSHPRLCIITAFPAESRPVRKHFQLRREDHAALPYPLYRSEHCVLIECGLGKLRAVAATASLLACHPSIRAALNVGIAGGAAPLGSCQLAHAVTDRASNRCWYPDLPPQRLLPGVDDHTLVETVDTPDAHYQEDRHFDMEAAGVFSAAVPVLGTAGVQCLKIVSDGPQAPIEHIDKNAVSELIEQQLSPIRAMVDCLLARQEPARDHNSRVNTATQNLIDTTGRHSTSERHRLHALLSRHLALHDTLPSATALGTPRTAAMLADRLHTLVYRPLVAEDQI